MRLGIDSYSYHRYFGELRAGERDPGTRWTTWDVIDQAEALGVDGVSLETCYFPSNESFWGELAAHLDDAGLEVVLAWGHPTGLEMGTSQDAFRSMLEMVERAPQAGAELVRIVAGHPVHWRVEPEADVVKRLVPLLDEACTVASRVGVALAIETHCDLSAEALESLVERVGTGRLGVVFDTANVVRIGEDLLEAAARLAPVTRMLHLKDVLLAEADRDDPAGWWPCVALGAGDLELDATLLTMHGAGFDGLACVEMATMALGWDELVAVESSVEWLRGRLADHAA